MEVIADVAGVVAGGHMPLDLIVGRQANKDPAFILSLAESD